LDKFFLSGSIPILKLLSSLAKIIYIAMAVTQIVTFISGRVERAEDHPVDLNQVAAKAVKKVVRGKAIAKLEERF
jgi:hypothetical protein